jgi:hypothetical protein
MTGRTWLKHFAKIIDDKYQEKQWTDSNWTEFLGKVLDGVARKMKCRVARRRVPPKNDSGEYLGIDALFIDRSQYKKVDDKSQWNPIGFPRAAVEMENHPNEARIFYALWKILCVRVPIRVLICYQPDQIKANSLRKHLQDRIRRGRLMKRIDGDLLILIGNESVKEESAWSDYFTVYQWRNERLQKVKIPEW